MRIQRAKRSSSDEFILKLQATIDRLLSISERLLNTGLAKLEENLTLSNDPHLFRKRKRMEITAQPKRHANNGHSSPLGLEYNLTARRTWKRARESSSPELSATSSSTAGRGAEGREDTMVVDSDDSIGVEMKKATVVVSSNSPGANAEEAGPSGCRASHVKSASGVVMNSAQSRRKVLNQKGTKTRNASRNSSIGVDKSGMPYGRALYSHLKSLAILYCKDVHKGWVHQLHSKGVDELLHNLHTTFPGVYNDADILPLIRRIQRGRRTQYRIAAQRCEERPNGCTKASWTCFLNTGKGKGVQQFQKELVEARADETEDKLGVKSTSSSSRSSSSSLISSSICSSSSSSTSSSPSSSSS